MAAPDGPEMRDGSHQQRVVDALALGNQYRARRRAGITGIDGVELGQIALAPPIYLRDVAWRIRSAPALRLDEIHLALAETSRLYAEQVVAGLSPQEYTTLVCQASGLPREVVLASVHEIARGLTMSAAILRAAIPTGSVLDIGDARTEQGCGLFHRRAAVLAVLAAGNGPGVHAIWPQAVAAGYRTLVRPSSREPFTAQRLVVSMHLAGLDNYVALVPTDHTGADELIDAADLALVYGGADVVAKYRDDPRVLVQGPGHATVVVGADADVDQAIALTAQSVLSLGGAACVSASAVLVEGDASAFAARLQALFDQVRPLPGGQLGVAGVELPTASAEVAASLAAAVGRPVYHQPSLRTLRPQVTVVDCQSDPLVRRELPFPCVTVAPYDRVTGPRVLAGSLVVTVLSHDPQLVDPIVDEPTISNVYLGEIPTSWMDPLVPHDGYLADFLMRNRGVRVQSGWQPRPGRAR